MTTWIPRSRVSPRTCEKGESSFVRSRVWEVEVCAVPIGGISSSHAFCFCFLFLVPCCFVQCLSCVLSALPIQRARSRFVPVGCRALSTLQVGRASSQSSPRTGWPIWRADPAYQSGWQPHAEPHTCSVLLCPSAPDWTLHLPDFEFCLHVAAHHLAANAVITRDRCLPLHFP